jgi:hypothetical protein
MAEADRTVPVYGMEFEALECFRCEKQLHMKQVAMLLRTRPTDAFSCWCSGCTQKFVRWARVGLDIDEVGDAVVLF